VALRTTGAAVAASNMTTASARHPERTPHGLPEVERLLMAYKHSMRVRSEWGGG
jgi:hypothetical protein